MKILGGVRCALSVHCGGEGLDVQCGGEGLDVHCGGEGLDVHCGRGGVRCALWEGRG